VDPVPTRTIGGSLQETAQTYTAAQRRVIAAAVDLFGDHGVGGTSLQMIADHLGVTKAAVYYQFKTKEAIVVAVVTCELVPLEAALEAAEVDNPEPGAHEALLDQIIGLAVERRRNVATLQNDPVIVRFLTGHAPFRELWVRFSTTLLGPEISPADVIRTLVLGAAISGAVGHPFVKHIDDETLKAELLSIARRLVFAADG
jgi:AcrR family transcriptional regulator